MRARCIVSCHSVHVLHWLSRWLRARYIESSNSQWFCFSWNIGQVTSKFFYFHYLDKCVPDQCVHKIVYLVLKTGALVNPRLRCMDYYECVPDVQLSLAIPNPSVPWKIGRYIQRFGIEGVPSPDKTIPSPWRTVLYIQRFGTEGLRYSERQLYTESYEVTFAYGFSVAWKFWNRYDSTMVISTKLL